MQLIITGNISSGIIRKLESITNQYSIKKYHNYGIQTVSDLRFDLNNIDSYELIAKNIERTNFLEWTGLRHSVPFNLRNLGPVRSDVSPSFKIDNGLFDVTKKKSKDYYSLLVLKKARLPNYAQKLKCEFNLSDEELKKAFLLPHSVAFEPYVKAFQFKVLNSILTQIQNCVKLVSLQTICVLSANTTRKQCNIFFMTVYTQGLSGKNLNRITCP